MKELEVTLRVRNNRLKERRTELGLSQPDFAALVGISFILYAQLENLRLSPRRKNGEWRNIALALAKFHCVEPEDLFPAAVTAIENPAATRKVDAADMALLLSDHQTRLLESPDADFDRRELAEQVENVLAELSPRQADVLRRSFGLGDQPPQTLDEIGEVLGVSKARASQIGHSALYKLGTPKRAAKLRPWVQRGRNRRPA